MNTCKTTGHPLITLAHTKTEKHGHMTTTVTLVQLASVHTTHTKSLMAVPRGAVRLSSS